MGVKDLIKTIKKYAPAAVLKLQPVAGSVIGIDLSIHIYGWVACAHSATDCGMTQIRRGILRQMELCHRAGIRPIYVVDGAPSLAKEATLAKRKAVVGRVRIDRKVWGEVTEFITLVGASYIQALGEADTILAALYRDGWIVGVDTADSDILALGATIVHIPAEINSGGWAAINADIAQHALAMDRDKWRVFCVAHGTDYNGRVSTPARMLKTADDGNRIIEKEIGKLMTETETGRAAMFGPLDAMERISSLPPINPANIGELRRFELGAMAENRINNLAGIGGDFDLAT